MTTKMEIARTIASFIKHHPHGITTADLYKEYGAAFQDIEGGVTRGSAVDLISKALASMVGKGLADFSEQSGGHRVYFPINGQETAIPDSETEEESGDHGEVDETGDGENGPEAEIKAVNIVRYQTRDGSLFDSKECAIKYLTRKKLEQEITGFFDASPCYKNRECVEFALDFLMFRDHGDVLDTF